jgi:hypothetical protein
MPTDYVLLCGMRREDEEDVRKGGEIIMELCCLGFVFLLGLIFGNIISH